MGIPVELTKIFENSPTPDEIKHQMDLVSRASDLFICIIQKDLQGAKDLIIPGATTTNARFFVPQDPSTKGHTPPVIDTPPLFWACMSGAKDFVELFLKEDPLANPYAKVSSVTSLVNQMSPFEAAKKMGFEDIVTLIKEKRGEPPTSGLRRFLDCIMN